MGSLVFIPLQLALFAAGVVRMKLAPGRGPARWAGALLAFVAMMWVMADPMEAAVVHALVVAIGGYFAGLVVARRLRGRPGGLRVSSWFGPTY